MKRDMDLVRKILLTVEGSEEGMYAESFTDDQNDYAKVAYTIDLMKGAGLLQAHIQKIAGGQYGAVYVDTLTWDGHDFLDSVRSNKVWAKVKQKIAQEVVSAPFSVVKKVAEALLEGILMS